MLSVYTGQSLCFHILNKWPTRGLWNELSSYVIYKSSHHICYIYMYSAMMRGVQNIHWMRYDCCYWWQHSW